MLEHSMEENGRKGRNVYVSKARGFNTVRFNLGRLLVLNTIITQEKVKYKKINQGKLYLAKYCLNKSITEFSNGMKS